MHVRTCTCHLQINNHMRNINHTRVERKPHTRKSHEVDDYLEIGERRELCRKLGLSEGQFVAYTDGSCWNQDPFRCGGAAYVVLDHEGGHFESQT